MRPIRTEVRTPRLTLRPPRREDAVPIATLVNDFEVARMLSLLPHPYGLADAEAYLDMVARKDPDREQSFCIEHPSFGVLGIIGLHGSDDADPELGPEIGYWIGRTFWGQGFASEATCGLLGWASESWGRRAVVSGHYVDNPASGSVLCKVGFLYTGEVRWRFNPARQAEVATRMMVWLA